MLGEVLKKGPSAKLRTKTGCLTCRVRRKKCDEQSPVCQRCFSSSRECIWPTREALIDRRNGSRPPRHLVECKDESTNIDVQTPATLSRFNTDGSDSSASSIGSNSSASTTTETTISIKSVDDRVDSASPEAHISLESEAISKELQRLQIEPFISKHFVDTYYRLIVNPESHLEFYDDGLSDIQTSMSGSKALHYSVLANSASHLSYSDENPALHELSLNYYSRSMRGLAQTLAGTPRYEEHNAILISVILLYLHGHLGRGTWHDIPFHLRAATRIIKVKYLQDPNLTITRPFDRLAIESVLFQIFLVSTAHWSRSSKKHNYEFDVKFWLDCETLLTRSTMFPGRSLSCNSPVLGIPIPLVRLNLLIKRVCDNLKLCTPDTLAHLQSEASYWEAAITLGQERSTLQRSLCDDATFLYILIATLLVEQLTKHVKHGGQEPPHPEPVSCWQLSGMLKILRRRHDDEGWHRTFVANWPVYTVGLFVSTVHDVVLVRTTMERRWRRLNIYLVSRYIRDLENFWMECPLAISALPACENSSATEKVGTSRGKEKVEVINGKCTV